MPECPMSHKLEMVLKKDGRSYRKDNKNLLEMLRTCRRQENISLELCNISVLLFC